MRISLIFLLFLGVLPLTLSPVSGQEVERYVRFQTPAGPTWGLMVDEQVYPLAGTPYGPHQVHSEPVPLADLVLLAPVDPSKVVAVGLNYQSHLGDREPAPYPGLFAKFPTSIVGPEDAVIRPRDSRNLHYEGEMVLVVGKRAEDVPVESAAEYVFGVTAGNDISERDWQSEDLQWFRAKAADTFGPVGPFLVRGLDANDLLLETRVNGEVRQSERTRDLLFGVEEIISYVSRYVTLLPGDIIFTGTPGSTRAMEPGDTVEVELEGVGILRNVIRQEGGR